MQVAGLGAEPSTSKHESYFGVWWLGLGRYPVPGMPSNPPEALFLALLVLQRAINTQSVQSTDAWARDASTSSSIKDGMIPDGPEWRMHEGSSAKRCALLSVFGSRSIVFVLCHLGAFHRSSSLSASPVV